MSQVPIEIKQAMMREGVYSSPSQSFTKKFRVYKTFDPSELDLQSTGFVYIFFVAPDLNVESDHTIKKLKLKEMYTPSMYSALSQSAIGNVTGKHFIKPLTNLSQNLAEADYSAEAGQSWENFAGKAVATSAGKSKDYNINFSVNFVETNDLYITNLHKIWLEYIYYAKRGYISRSDENIRKNVLDYVGAVYVFHTEPDGRTITYWSKYTGVFPTSLPFGANGSEDATNHDVSSTVSVSYQASSREVMTYGILEEFSQLTKSGTFDTRDQAQPNQYESETESGMAITAGDGRPDLGDSNLEDMFKAQIGASDGSASSIDPSYSTPNRYLSKNNISIRKVNRASNGLSYRYQLIFY